MAYQSFYGSLPQPHFNMNNFTVVDKVPQELLHLVDKHWYQFPPSKIKKNFFKLKLFENKLYFFFTSESIMALDSRICNFCVRAHRDAWKLVRALHFFKNKISTNSIEFVRDESRLFGLYDYVHDGTTDGHQLLL